MAEAFMDRGIKLLPCPFCGCRPKIHAERSGEDCMDTWVECTDCGAKTDRFEGAYSEPEGAAALWNGRAAPAEPWTAEERAAVLEAAEHRLDGRTLQALAMREKGQPVGPGYVAQTEALCSAIARGIV